MNFKKIIAREFLFLLSLVSLVGIMFLGFIGYNSFQKFKAESIVNDKLLLEYERQKFLSYPLKAKDSITQNILNKMIEFYNGNPKIENHKSIYSEFPQLRNDSTLLNASFDYNATTKSGKYKSLKEVNLRFPEFFIVSQSDVDSLNYYNSNIELLQKDSIKHTNKIFKTSDILDQLYVFGFWLFIICFGLRYLFYATKWAINAIKD